MTETLLTWFATYGLWLVLVGVFLDVAGVVPIPGEVYLLMAGALTWTGELSFLPALLLGAMAASLGDFATFYLGRRGGRGLIAFYCKYTLCSAQCSLKTESFFLRFGGVALVFGRFLVGVRTLACPLAGASGMTYRRFAAYDLPGVLLWSALFTSLGYLFSPQVQALADWVSRVTHSIVPLLFLVVALIIGRRYYRRRRYGPAESVPAVPKDSAPTVVSSSSVSCAHSSRQG